MAAAKEAIPTDVQKAIDQAKMAQGLGSSTEEQRVLLYGLPSEEENSSNNGSGTKAVTTPPKRRTAPLKLKFT